MIKRLLNIQAPLPFHLRVLSVFLSLCSYPIFAQQPELGTETLDILQVDSFYFKDHNKNGSLDIYEDWRLSPEQRAEHLVSLMTIEEKAGAMLHGTLPLDQSENSAGLNYDLLLAEGLIQDRNINHLVTRLTGNPRQIAEENNRIQILAESSRLGIPVTVSTDPRHHFQFTEGASVANTGFSQWPETLGFAALRDPDLVKRFADIARQEYRAVGIHMGLSPQADLSTEPRWSRINGTFGEDATLAKTLVQAYVEGFQNGSAGIHEESVSLVVKHWTGYGAAAEGFDSHNYYGRYAIFPGDNFDYHAIPFEGAFNANVAGVMPTYSILKDLTIQGAVTEQVGVGFNRFILTNLLKNQYGFKGVILSDWGITKDCFEACISGKDAEGIQGFHNFSSAWGVINLTMEERFAKGIDAGIDQFGGVEDTQVLASTINKGMVNQESIDNSVRHILTQKLSLGLFEKPLVNIEKAASLVGNQDFSQQSEEVQSRSLVLLENTNNLLPLTDTGTALYLHGIDAAIAQTYGFKIVDDPEKADIAIIRASAPYQILHPDYVFGRMQHEGDLSFKDGNTEYEQIKKISAIVPTIVTVYLDRPAILTNIIDKADAILGNFGISDAALMDVIVGNIAPQGKLPFELPANMERVREQQADVPFDTADELFSFGFGLEYEAQ
ncbi:MAG: glycoside hydrolase family 3 N-terminal domain-containing protein [Gammaproteobacteria bacterium]|nr:glycoside hydrolase family 3 N-terminal domain-containing protein [Gammaproteobacteria bacterium]